MSFGEVAALIFLAAGVLMWRDWVLQAQSRRFRKEQWERDDEKEEENKVVARIALRRQVGQEFLDIDFNVKAKDTQAEIIDNVKDKFDLSGYCLEKIKDEMEEEIAKKRKELQDKDKVKHVRH